MVNWSSESFIEELSFVAFFLNPLTHRHTPGIESGYKQAPRPTGQDVVLHRLLIPSRATYLTEGRDPRSTHTSLTSRVENVQHCLFTPSTKL